MVGDAKGKKFYQYTAIDEYSRFRYLEAFEEHSTYSSAIFLEHLIRLSSCLFKGHYVIGINLEHALGA